MVLRTEWLGVRTRFCVFVLYSGSAPDARLLDLATPQRGGEGVVTTLKSRLARAAWTLAALAALAAALGAPNKW